MSVSVAPFSCSLSSFSVGFPFPPSFVLLCLMTNSGLVFGFVFFCVSVSTVDVWFVGTLKLLF